jgi:Protein of unknown function (DUF664)
MPGAGRRRRPAPGVQVAALATSPVPVEPQVVANSRYQKMADYLHGYRLTMQMKCAGLDPAQLARRSVPPSTMSLLGLIRHMADVERNWFRRVMAQADAPPLYWSEDLADADWAGAVADPAVVDESCRR